MKSQEYIERQLKNLKEFNPRNVSKENLADEIFRLVMSKKFRKYSANPALVEQIKSAIKLRVDSNQPIIFVFPHGAYKLWRLEEAPYPDWAELFAAMYYTKWLKPICEIYAPGVILDFYVMDLIIPKINNIPLEDIEAYIKEYQKILDFLKVYQPKNLKMTITRAGSQFLSEQDFEEALKEYIEKLSTSSPKLVEEELKIVELNTKVTQEQQKDPTWKEKVLLIHDAYINMERDKGYYFNANKIPVTTQSGGSGRLLAVGTTKTSIAKFWVGVGVLMRIGDSYMEYILSPKQLESAEFTKEEISIAGLDSRNFKRIRIVVN